MCLEQAAKTPARTERLASDAKINETRPCFSPPPPLFIMSFPHMMSFKCLVIFEAAECLFFFNL